jgi:hypothetical protein
MPSLTFKLHKLFNDQERFYFPFKHRENEIPWNGIYVIFEKGEKFGDFDRIVRVGTHTGENQLRSRLNQHFVKENKNRSIFRKNIGRCILNINISPYLPLWELDVTSKEEKVKFLKLLDLDFEKHIEKRISSYIQDNLSFCVFRVDTKEQRLFWESKIVSTLARSGELHPSENWLGNFSTKDKIRKIGLWQVNELYNAELTEVEFNDLVRLINIKDEKHKLLIS